MRVLIFAAHYPVSAGRCMLDAFRRIGVDARSIGPAFGTRVWKIDLPAETAWTPAGSAEASWADWTPDLVLVMDLRAFHHPVYRDVPHVVYAVDNHVRDFTQAGIAHYFLAHRHGPAMPVDGIPDRTWLPCGYDPTIFTPSAVPWQQRKFDVALIGNLYRQRQMVLEAIRTKIEGVRVRAGVGAVYGAYRDIYHDARISLNVSARGDVAMRIFETAAMGCVVVSDPLDDLADLGADGVVACGSVDEMVEKVRELLADAAGSEELARRAAAWAKPHTWDARAAFIREWWSKNFGVGG